MSNNQGTLHIYEPSNFPQGIKGFIDAQGIADLLWVQENLGGVMKIAGGRCPNCGNKQIAIYMGFTKTNCLICRYELSLAPKTANLPPLIEEQATVDVDYEDVEETRTGVDKLAFIPFNANPNVSWPVKRDWYTRTWSSIKIVFKPIIYRLIDHFKQLFQFK